MNKIKEYYNSLKGDPLVTKYYKKYADFIKAKRGDDAQQKIDQKIDLEIKKLQDDFEAAKKTGKGYLERYIELMKKEKQKFVGDRVKLEASMTMLKAQPQIVRLDLLLRVLKSLKLGGTVAGANTVKFLGGEMVRAFDGAIYKCNSDDPKLCTKILAKYGVEQYKQDMLKLNALTLYFDRSITALKLAIDVRDGKIPPDKKPISLGAYKLGHVGIKTFSQLPGVTCPGKGDCFNWCFALSGHTAMPNVGIKSYAKNLGASERDDFEARVNTQLKRMRTRSQGKITFNGQQFDNIIRIHAYGDFHTASYVNKWKRIAEENPNVFFYAYTKSFYMTPVKQWMKDIAAGKVKNVKILQSYGSKYDNKIDDSLPHAKVFDNIESLKKAGYVNCDDSDLVAADPANPNIGIIKHGNTPCSASMCPWQKTTASCKKALHLQAHEMPIIHLGDQIDMHHHLDPHILEEMSGLEPHLTTKEHQEGFGKHFNSQSFFDTVTSKYTLKINS
jgi:hypothetical protein